jgi:hypothetical protein
MLSHDDIRELTRIVQEVDRIFENEGGGTRHWVRDYFLPELEASGWVVHPDDKLCGVWR